MVSPEKKKTKPEFVILLLNWFKDRGFKKFFSQPQKEGGYLITSLSGDFRLWILFSGRDLVIKNLWFKEKGVGMGTGLIEVIKRISSEKGFGRIIADNVSEASWDFWLNKCNFEYIPDTRNAEFITGK
jgi:hypothetical protein